MSGIIPIDRRDLNRLLNGLIHAERRDDVRVEVKYYVQFSFAGTGGDAMAVQTLMDPYNPPNRRAMRDLVAQAIKRLDDEEEKLDAEAESIVSNHAAAAAAVAGVVPAVVAPEPVHHQMAAETGYYNLADGANGAE